ncbi:20980_t:CDS:2, partial [Gigaspora margarita]
MLSSIYFIIVLCLISACASYDGIKARNYATAHCDNKKHNAAYPTFPEDCTNFASQVLEAGGISQSTSWYCHKPCKKTPGSRCYNDYEYTTSWSVVDDLYNYLIKNKIARKCDLKDLQPGDLIQYNKKKTTFFFWTSDDWHHTAISITFANKSAITAHLGSKRHKKNKAESIEKGNLLIQPTFNTFILAQDSKQL